MSLSAVDLEVAAAVQLLPHETFVVYAEADASRAGGRSGVRVRSRIPVPIGVLRARLDRDCATDQWTQCCAAALRRFERAESLLEALLYAASVNDPEPGGRRVSQTRRRDFVQAVRVAATATDHAVRVTPELTRAVMTHNFGSPELFAPLGPMTGRAPRTAVVASDAKAAPSKDTADLAAHRLLCHSALGDVPLHFVLESLVPGSFPWTDAVVGDPRAPGDPRTGVLIRPFVPDASDRQAARDALVQYFTGDSARHTNVPTTSACGLVRLFIQCEIAARFAVAAPGSAETAPLSIADFEDRVLPACLCIIYGVRQTVRAWFTNKVLSPSAD